MFGIFQAVSCASIKYNGVAEYTSNLPHGHDVRKINLYSCAHHVLTLCRSNSVHVQVCLFLGLLYPVYASYKALLTPGTADDHQVRPLPL